MLVTSTAPGSDRDPRTGKVSNIRVLLTVLAGGIALGLAILAIEKCFDLKHDAVSFGIVLVIGVLLLVSLPLIYRFYIRFAQELGDNTKQQDSNSGQGDQRGEH